MDEKTVRNQLEDVKRELAKNEDEREILTNLLKGLEGWLRLHGTQGEGVQLPLPSEPKLTTSSPKGGVTMRSMVIRVLQEARGEPLHTREILMRARALGADTNAKDPVGIVDLLSHSIKKAGIPIEKVQARTWRWTGSS